MSPVYNFNVNLQKTIAARLNKYFGLYAIIKQETFKVQEDILKRVKTLFGLDKLEFNVLNLTSHQIRILEQPSSELAPFQPFKNTLPVKFNIDPLTNITDLVCVFELSFDQFQNIVLLEAQLCYLLEECKQRDSNIKSIKQVVLFAGWIVPFSYKKANGKLQGYLDEATRDPLVTKVPLIEELLAAGRLIFVNEQSPAYLLKNVHKRLMKTEDVIVEMKTKLACMEKNVRDNTNTLQTLSSDMKTMSHNLKTMSSDMNSKFDQLFRLLE